MKKIIISGDSWGCGEWGGDRRSKKDLITHLGLQQYLADAGNDVRNVSAPGRSNSVAIKNIKQELLKFVPDFIIWFQTDPLRENIRNKKFKTINDLITFGDQQINLSYKELNELGIPIFCVGGLSKLNLELLTQYENLNCLVESLPEYCVPGYKQPKVTFSHSWLNRSLKSFKELDQLICLKKESYEIWLTDPKFTKYFYPDGTHPNRKAHYKLYKLVEKQLTTDYTSFTIQ